MFDLIEKSSFLSKPIELLKIKIGATTYYYTSSHKTYIESNAQVWSKVPWERSSIKRAKKDNSDITISLPLDNEFASLYKVSVPSLDASVFIYRLNTENSDGSDEKIVMWSGRVLGASFKQDRAELTCQSSLSSLDRQGLKERFSFGCNNSLFSEKCGVNINSFSKIVTVNSLEDGGILIASDDITETDVRYYVAGLASFNGQHRMITDFNPELKRIEILAGFENLKIGDQIRITKGCNKSIESCKSFDNKQNFRGFIYLPDRNIFMTGLE